MINLFKKIFKIFLSIFIPGTAVFIMGCASDGASDYLSSASVTQDCERKQWKYSVAILSEFNDKILSSPNIDNAIFGMKSTAPGCDSNPQKVATHLFDTVNRLAEVEHPGFKTVADLYLDYLEKRPNLFVQINSLYIDKIYKIDRELARKFLRVAMERGFWDVNDMEWGFKYGSKDLFGSYSMEMTQLNNKITSAATKARDATKSECDFYYCKHTNNTASTFGTLNSLYRRVYANELRRLGLGNSRRVLIAEQMAQKSDKENSEWELRLSKIEEKEKSSVDSMSVIGAVMEVAEKADPSKAPLYSAIGKIASPGNKTQASRKAISSNLRGTKSDNSQPANAARTSVPDLGSDCQTAEKRGMAQIEEIRQRALGGKLGACESARLNRRVGEIGLAVYTVCNSQEGIESMKQMIIETETTISGVCS